MHQLRVQCLVVADRVGEIPIVDDQVRDELGDVFVAGDVAEGQVDDLLHRVHGVNGSSGGGEGLVPHGLWSRTQEVAIEAVADIGYRLAGEEQRDP